MVQCNLWTAEEGTEVWGADQVVRKLSRFERRGSEDAEKMERRTAVMFCHGGVLVMGRRMSSGLG